MITATLGKGLYRLKEVNGNKVRNLWLLALPINMQFIMHDCGIFGL